MLELSGSSQMGGERGVCSMCDVCFLAIYWPASVSDWCYSCSLQGKRKRDIPRPRTAAGLGGHYRPCVKKYSLRVCFSALHTIARCPPGLYGKMHELADSDVKAHAVYAVLCVFAQSIGLPVFPTGAIVVVGTEKENMISLDPGLPPGWGGITDPCFTEY